MKKSLIAFGLEVRLTSLGTVELVMIDQNNTQHSFTLLPSALPAVIQSLAKAANPPRLLTGVSSVVLDSSKEDRNALARLEAIEQCQSGAYAVFAMPTEGELILIMKPLDGQTAEIPLTAKTAKSLILDLGKAVSMIEM